MLLFLINLIQADELKKDDVFLHPNFKLFNKEKENNSKLSLIDDDKLIYSPKNKGINKDKVNDRMRNKEGSDRDRNENYKNDPERISKSDRKNNAREETRNNPSLLDDSRADDPRNIDSKHNDSRTDDPKNNDSRSDDTRNNNSRSDDTRNNNFRPDDSRNNTSRSDNYRTDDSRNRSDRREDFSNKRDNSTDDGRRGTSNNEETKDQVRDDTRNNSPNQREKDNSIPDETKENPAFLPSSYTPPISSIFKNDNIDSLKKKIDDKIKEVSELTQKLSDLKKDVKKAPEQRIDYKIIEVTDEGK